VTAPTSCTASATDGGSSGERNGWRNSKKEPVANTDLWMPLVELVVERQPSFRWVKGHSGDPMNDLVDRLAVAASVECA